MTTQQKLIQKKLSLLELGEFLNNISEACRIHGCSRQHFYDIKKAHLSYVHLETTPCNYGGKR
jgi:hypothetical protein